MVNNQVTTETGYALDARQANPNLDGTLAKQVADLNGSLIERFRKCIKISYTDSSDNGVTVSYGGVAIALIFQGGSLGCALYLINSTNYTFDAIKIIDTLTSFPVTFSSENLSNATFRCSWNTAGYGFNLIPLT